MSSRTEDTTGVMKEALHNSLDGITVSGTTVPHFEKVKANQSMPYLVNGRVNMTPRPYTPGAGYRGSQNFEIQIDGFSNYDGDKEIDAIRDAVVGVLMETMTVQAGYRITKRTLNNSFTIDEEDTEIRHGVVEVTLAMQLL